MKVNPIFLAEFELCTPQRSARMAMSRGNASHVVANMYRRPVLNRFIKEKKSMLPATRVVFPEAVSDDLFATIRMRREFKQTHGTGYVRLYTYVRICTAESPEQRLSNILHCIAFKNNLYL